MTWHVGDRVYLVPVVPTAPRVAYQMPACRVTALHGRVRVEVELDDGHRLWTSVRNIVATLPEPAKPRPKPARRGLVLAENEQEITLW